MGPRPKENDASSKSKLTILDFVVAIGLPIESIDAESIPMEFFDLG
eukprot:CAMPEP_0116036950 /NCGR_PEP_ID=MMETSP0321-20121206/21620_1 /TAXON_ID=163516 /ORGANISM="Leptocylindrus danicus var. danicus, Strain B650" /LENGTH=45 /DNA_ID= /DNA_START= /DNA_END= /DNA_ORIENTATION=